jgi:hypothetical protein
MRAITRHQLELRGRPIGEVGHSFMGRGSSQRSGASCGKSNYKYHIERLALE